MAYRTIIKMAAAVLCAAALAGAAPIGGVAPVERARAVLGRCEGAAQGGPVSSWTGGCAGGWRDGAGRLTTLATGADGVAAADVSDGSFVAGRQVGLWCAVAPKAAGDPAPPAEQVCRIATADRPPPDWTLRHLPSGDWDLAPAGGPPATVAAATVEALSARLIADARAGRSSGLFQLPFASPILDGFAANSAITLIDEPGQFADLNGKRVAVVLTAATSAELARFAALRNAFVVAHGFGGKLPRDTAAALSAAMDPARFTPGLTAALTPLAGSVTPATDLTALTAGQADYALVVDWRFSGGPVRPRDWPVSGGFTQTYTAILVDAKLKARRVTGASVAIAPGADYASGIAAAFADPWPADGGGLTGQIAYDLARGLPPAGLLQASVRYRDGTGVPADPARAAALRLRAADAGDGATLLALGREELAGTPATPKNPAAAVADLSAASDAGDLEATLALTSLLSSGQQGVTKDLPRAAIYAKRAFDAMPVADSAYNYGLSLQFGWAGTPDYAEALRVYRIAVAAGDPGDAAKRIAEVEPKLAQQQAAEVAAEVAAAKPAPAAPAPPPVAASSEGDDRSPAGICRDKLAENETFLATLETKSSTAETQLRARWQMYIARSRLDTLDAFCKDTPESRQQRPFVQQAADSAAKDCVVAGDPKLCSPARPPSR